MTVSPRVIGEHRPDYHNLASILQFSRFQGLADEALVLALYDFFTDTDDGTYHFWPVDELQGQPFIRRFVSDPIKLLNVYGWHICGQSSQILYALYRAAGLTARQFSIPGHLLCEVYYDDAWHVLDVDMWTWFRNERGQIASAYELTQRSQELIVENTNTAQPCNLPDRSLESYAATYAQAATLDDRVRDIFPHSSISGHHMDFCLRPGESVTLSESANGAFICPDAWLQQIRDGHSEWRGFPRERFEPFRSYGNGVWAYAPKLSADAHDFAAGVWEQEGIEQDAAGLRGSGSARFRFQSPYVFAATPILDDGESVTYCDGAELHVVATGAVEIYLELEERTLLLASFSGETDTHLDLTPYVVARYEFILSFRFIDQARLHAMRFSSPIMVAPKSLPKLTVGANTLHVNSGDAYGRQTIPWKQIIDFSLGSQPQEQAHSHNNVQHETWAQGWSCLAPQESDEPIELVYALTAPVNKRLSWFHVLCAVKEGPEAAASLYWSNDAEQWHLIEQAALDHTHFGWDTTLAGDVLLADHLEMVYVKIVSDTAVTSLECYGHLAVPEHAIFPVEIEHKWTELGQGRSAAASPSGAYTLHCAAQPCAHQIRLWVPSQTR